MEPTAAAAKCVPYARYGETPDGIVAAIEAVRPAVEQGLDRDALQRRHARRRRP